MAGLKDVAKRAGVSVSTASDILRCEKPRHQHDEEYVRRVLDAARKLKYVPNFAARALHAHRAFTLGMPLSSDLSSLTSGFNALAVAGAADEAHRRGYEYLVVGRSPTESATAKAISYLRGHRIDAVLMPPYAWTSEEETEFFIQTGAPVILMSTIRASPLPVVEVDHTRGVDLAVEHLHKAGHRHVAWLGPNAPRDRVCHLRQAAFEAAVSRLGMQATVIPMEPSEISTHSAEEWIRIAHDTVMAKRARLDGSTAIVGYNEAVGMGVYAAAAELGLRIPLHLSVVGFDNVSAHLAYPPMTVVDHMMLEIGRTAAELAIQCVEDASAWRRLLGQRTQVQPRLMERGSVAPPAAAGAHPPAG